LDLEGLNKVGVPVYWIYRKSISVHSWTNYWWRRSQSESHWTWSWTWRSQQTKYVVTVCELSEYQL